MEMTVKSKFAWSVLFLQLLFIAIFAVYTKYGKDLDASVATDSSQLPEVQKDLTEGRLFLKDYPKFEDINALVFIGIGYLYSFLKRYGYSGVGMNLLLCGIGVQWGIITEGLWEMKDGKIELTVSSLIKGEFAAASAVIALGGIFGKVGSLQTVVFVIIEILTYTTLNQCRQIYMQVSDVGEAVALHMFAAVFGCSTAYMLDRNIDVQGNPNEGYSYNSNLFSMMGSLVVWVYWPSFNAAAVSASDVATRHRSVINTFLAIVGSGITCFAMSALLHKENKFTMGHIQNGALAGAVAVGAVSDLMIQPFGALAIGTSAGCLSVAGIKYFSPFLAKLKVYDPCVINSLHGLPGFYSGCIAVLMTFLANTETYGYRLYKFYPAMAPMANTTALDEIQKTFSSVIEPGLGRTMEYQALYQFIYILAIIALACISGLITGAVLRFDIFDPIEDKNMYLDDVMWDLTGIDEVKQIKQDSENASKIE